MKRSIELLLSAILLSIVFSFAACSVADDDNAEPEEDLGPIKGLTASLSEQNGTYISVDWEELDGPVGRYDVYRSVEGGEFERRGDADKPHFWDSKTERETTYAYYINYKESYSDTIEITTAPAGMPYISASASVTGEGDEAVLNWISVTWEVGSKDDINEYEILRDEEVIATVQPESTPGNEQTYKDQDNSLSFDNEYTYAVVAKMQNGDLHQSFNYAVTPVRPDAIDRPVPEFISVSSDAEEKTIDIIITDVSFSEYDLIHYEGELEGLNYSWDFQHKVNELSKDDDGNLILKLIADDATLISGQTTWLKSKVRIYTQGGWSEWSEPYRFFVF